MKFDVDYTIPNDFFQDGTVLCMGCGTPVMTTTYVEMPSRKNPKEKVNVVGKKKHANYTLVPMAASVQGRIVQSVAIVCTDCKNFECTDEVAVKITRQIVEAHKRDLAWVGLEPQESDPLMNIRIVGRL